MLPNKLGNVGMQLLNDRDVGFAAGMTDKDIHRVAVERSAKLLLRSLPLLALTFENEHCDILDEMGANCLKMISFDLKLLRDVA